MFVEGPCSLRVAPELNPILSTMSRWLNPADHKPSDVLVCRLMSQPCRYVRKASKTYLRQTTQVVVSGHLHSTTAIRRTHATILTQSPYALHPKNKSLPQAQNISYSSDIVVLPQTFPNQGPCTIYPCCLRCLLDFLQDHFRGALGSPPAQAKLHAQSEA